jgi:hypothetical protein
VSFLEFVSVCTSFRQCIINHVSFLDNVFVSDNVVSVSMIFRQCFGLYDSVIQNLFVSQPEIYQLHHTSYKIYMVSTVFVTT